MPLKLSEQYWQSGKGLPCRQYLVNHNKKFIYCPIPKVANSSLRLWVLRIHKQESKSSDINCEYSKENIKYANKYLTLSRYGDCERGELINDETYFKFVFVRNPWSKLVSAYLNLVVDNDKFSIKQLEPMYIFLRKDCSLIESQRLTFREFIIYVYNTPDEEINYHFKSQYLFFGDYSFNFIGKYEFLESQIGLIMNKLAITVPLPKINFNNYCNYDCQINCCADCDVSTLNIFLNQNGKFPHWKSFYNPELINFVGTRYKLDIAKFGYAPPKLS